MSGKMSDDKYLQEQFAALDTDKTGKIHTADFRRFVFDNSPVQGFRDSTINTYVAELSNHTGWITFQQFKKFMKSETDGFNNPLVIIELKQAFYEVDTNKDGFISPQEARQGITLAGQRIPGASFECFAKMFDDNRDGRLSLQEFLNNIKKLYSE